MVFKYDEYMSEFWDKFLKVELTPERYKKVEEFVPKLVEAKKKEKLHQIDGGQEIKRHMTGYLGESALEQLLGIRIVDWSIGDSRNYNHPDIKRYNIGIKTVEKGSFHIIFKENYYPQIICIKSDTQPNLIYVCGLATTDVLNKYQDTSLIKSKALAARGVKTGFYGYGHLLPVRSLSDIQKYKKW